MGSLIGFNPTPSISLGDTERIMDIYNESIGDTGNQPTSKVDLDAIMKAFVITPKKQSSIRGVREKEDGGEQQDSVSEAVKAVGNKTEQPNTESEAPSESRAGLEAAIAEEKRKAAEAVEAERQKVAELQKQLEQMQQEQAKFEQERQEQLEKERQAQLEQERLKQEQARLEQEKQAQLEKERLRQEREKLEREKLELERKKLEQERQAEQARLEQQQQAEQARLEQERQAKQAEQARLEQEKQAKQAEKARLEQARLEQQRQLALKKKKLAQLKQLQARKADLEQQKKAALEQQKMAAKVVSDTPEIPSKPKEPGIDYSSLEAEALFNKVREYAVQNGLVGKLIDRKKLDNIFGERNISRLIFQSYLISIGKGVTFGNG